MFEFDRSYELEQDLRDPTYEKEDDVMPRNDTSALQRQISIDFERIKNGINLEDCFLERQPTNQRGSSLFFGLAIVFGVVGAVTSTTSMTTDRSIVDISDVKQIYTGSHLVGDGEERSGEQSHPLKDGIEYEGLPSCTEGPNNLTSHITASRLLSEAFKSVPVFTYISFALSLFFLILYLNPLGQLLQQSTIIS